MDSNPTVGIDLHVHSTASDGTLSPHALIDLARKSKLGAIALTDHDSVSGARQVVAGGVPTDIHFLTGVEISAAPPSIYPGKGSFHILGYGIDLFDPTLTKALETLQASRKNRNPQILTRLNALGIPLTMADVLTEAGDPDQLGRPHIARILVKKGLVKDIDEAFDRYLGNGKPAYVEKYRIPCGRAIEIIRNAGGVAVLAHPGLLKNTDGIGLERIVAHLKDLGLSGIEVFYPEHDSAMQSRFAAIAKRLELLMTGGTDFHGSLKPEVHLGTGYGDLHVPMDVYYRLMDVLAGNGIAAPTPIQQMS